MSRVRFHRPVTAQDFPVVCSFAQNEEELFYLFPTATYPLTTDQLARTVAQRSAPTVVEDGGRVVAFADLFRVKYSGYTNIGNVMVAPHARGCGVGSYLIEQMIALAQATFGTRKVRISCFSRNTAGLLLYSKLGFVPYALEERTDWQGERVALLHLRKSLRTR